MNEQENIIDTFSEMAPRYESLMNNELNRFWGVSYPEFVNELIEGIDFGSDQKILDLATGTAFIPQTISEKGISYKQFIGLDITFEMLFNAKTQISRRKMSNPVQLVCASAHSMPFKKDTFDIVTCCLATHHMNVDMLLDQTFLFLNPGGEFQMADVGGSRRWKVGFIRSLIKVIAFLYFFFKENLSRARSESEAVPNVLTIEEWEKKILAHGFESIKTKELKSKRFWIPNPVFIKAKKPMED